MNELTITGMTCDHCRSAVTSALESVPGVLRASVSLESGLAEIEGSADPAALVRAVEEEGYGAQHAG